MKVIILGLGVLLTAIAILIVSAPLMFKPYLSENLTVLEQKKIELSRQLLDGLIDEPQYQTTKSEFERTFRQNLNQPDQLIEGSKRNSEKGILIAFSVIVPAVATIFYLQTGSPSLPGLTFAERSTERAESSEIIVLAERLQRNLDEDPEGGASEGWMLLGQTYFNLGKYDRAIDAYFVVSQRRGAGSSVFSRLAEALITGADGIVDPRAQSAISRSLELDPLNPAASFYQSVALAQAGNLPASHAVLKDRLLASANYEPWMDSFVKRANFIAEELGINEINIVDIFPSKTNLGPTESDVEIAENMSSEERDIFIRSMVARLASKLENDPKDIDGWIRLGRSYGVLSDPQAAVVAYETALELLDKAPNDPRGVIVRNVLETLR